MDRKVSTSQLKQGMFITHLDRPWIDTPFLYKDTTLENSEDINLVREYCNYVYIDPERGIAADSYLDDMELEKIKFEIIEESGNHVKKKPTSHQNNTIKQYTKIVNSIKDAKIKSLKSLKSTTKYKDTTHVLKELKIAKKSHTESSNVMIGMMQDIFIGKKIDLITLSKAVTPMIESIIRNPDAYMWLTKLKEKDSYTYTHSVDTCALSIIFGRHIGLPREELNIVAMSALMLDVGKIRCPTKLLTKPEKLTNEEFDKIKKHVEYSLQVVDGIDEIPEEVKTIIASHHERHDGSGYPTGIKGHKIPIFSSIVALIDCYDAMTSYRPYSPTFAHHSAIHMIYSWRNVLFRSELIEQFIQCLGVYPVGSIVELNTGEVAIVIGLNRTRRLQPKIMLILDQDKKQYNNFKELDLMDQDKTNPGTYIKIENTLEPESYGIRPDELFL